LKKIEGEAKPEITAALALLAELMETQEVSTNYTQLNLDESQQNKNMLSTMRLLPRI
jgi:hypothetical protein